MLKYQMDDYMQFCQARGREPNPLVVEALTYSLTHEVDPEIKTLTQEEQELEFCRIVGKLSPERRTAFEEILKFLEYMEERRCGS